MNIFLAISLFLFSLSGPLLASGQKPNTPEIEQLQVSLAELADNSEIPNQAKLNNIIVRLGAANQYQFMAEFLISHKNVPISYCSELLVKELLNAPPETEFQADVAEALIGHLDQLLRAKGGGDEVESGRRIIAHRIAISLESTFGIPLDGFDWGSPKKILKYVDDAEISISRFRVENKTFLVSPDGTGPRTFRRGIELMDANLEKSESSNTAHPPIPQHRENLKTPEGSQLDAADQLKRNSVSVEEKPWWVYGGILTALFIACLLVRLKLRSSS